MWSRARRRRAPVTAVALATVVALVVTTAGIAYAAFAATTSNTASSFSTLFTPNSTADTLSAQLGSGGTIYATAIAGNTLYVGGDFTSIGGVTRNRLAAFDLNTNTLTGWDPNVNSIVWALAVDATNNLVYAGGQFTTVNGGVTRNRLAAFSLTTGTASAWNPNANNIVYSLALDNGTFGAGQKIYAGGAFTNMNGSPGVARNRLAAIDTSSGSATAFNPNVANNNVYSLAVDNTNSIVYASGDYTLVNGTTARARLAAFATSDGTATSWDPEPNSTVWTIALDGANGLVYAGGAFSAIGDATRNELAAVSTSNGLANAWDPNMNNTVRALAVDSAAGIVYAGGVFTTVGNSASLRNRIAAVSIATDAPVAWNPNADSTVYSLALDAANNRIAFAGAFASVDVTDRDAIAVNARATTTDPDATTAGLPDIGTTGAVRAELLSGSTLYLGGEFTYVNGVARKHLAAIDVGTGNLTSWNPGADGIVRAFALDTTNHVLYAGGDFVTAAGQLRNRLAAFSTADGSLTSWVSGASATVNALAVDPANSVLYVGGAFTTIGFAARNRLASVSTATGSATAWNPNVSNNVTALQLDTTNSVVYAAGLFTTVAAGVTTRNRVASWSTVDGSLTSFDPNLNSTARALALDAAHNLLYAGGDFTAVNGTLTARNRLAAFDTTTSTATSWDPNANNSVFTLALDTANNAIYAGASFTTLNGGTSRNRLAAISTTTGTVTAWNPNVGATDVFSLAVDLASGTAYAGGDFTTAVGANREALAAITNGPAGVAAAGALSISSAGNLGGVLAMVRDGNTLYLGGTFTYVGGVARNRLAAIDLSNNTLTAWDPNANSIVRALALDTGSSLLYAGGDFTTLNGATTRNRLAAISTATGTVTAWNPNVNNTVRAVALDTGSSLLYAGGDFTTSAGGVTTRNRAAAFSTVTGTANGFNPNVNSSVYMLAVDGANGLVYASGSFTAVNGFTTRNRLAALGTAAGTATAWDPNANSTVESILLDSTNGLLYVGGDFTTVGGATRTRLAAVSTSTGAATSWNPVANNTVNTIALDATNNVVYVAGAFTTINARTRNRVAAVPTSSSSPLTWNPNLSATAHWIVLTATDVVVGGDWELITMNERSGVGRFALAVSDAAMSYQLPGQVIVSSVTTPNVNTVVVNGSTMYVGGDFVAAGTTPRRRLAAWDLTTNTLLPWNPGANASVRALALDAANGILYAGGDFTTVNGTTVRNFLAALSTSTGTATSWDPSPNTTVRALLVDTTNTILYAGGDFTSVNTTTSAVARSYLAGFSTSTGTATSLTAGLSTTVRALALDTTNGILYAGGDFVSASGGAATRNRLAAFATSNGTLTSFDPNMGGIVRALALDPINGVLYAGGAFTSVNGGMTRNRIAALSTATGTATSWDPNFSENVFGLAYDQVGTLYAVGTFVTVNGATTRNRGVAISTTTGTATAWNPNFNAGCNAVGLGVGHLAVGGAFTTVNGATARVSLATFVT